MSDQTNGGLSTLSSGQWSSGWPLAQAFEYNGKAYCFFYQNDGTYEVDVLTPSPGTPGWSRVLRNNIGTGYSKLVVYTDPSSAKPIALLYNENTGEYVFYEIEL